MRRLALLAIRAYQRHLSPHKGFSCAYRVHTGRASCSTLGYRAIRRYGLVTGLALLRRRTRLCGVAHRRHAPSVALHHAAQRGVCDLGCDLPCHVGCDLPGDCDGHHARQFASCCDCSGCDWPRRSDRPASRRERGVYIPPKANSGRPRRGSGARDLA